MEGLKKRPNIVIYKDILGALLSGPMGPTRLARVCNVPYDRLTGYANILESGGFLRREIQEGHEIFHLTREGYQLHDDMEKVWSQLRI